MSVLHKILTELDEIYLVNHIKKDHDEARMQYHLKSNTVLDDTQFDDMIADYFNYHFTRCVTGGGKLSRAEAASRAKKIILKEYHKRGKDKLHAYADGKNGTNEGMRGILDIILYSLRDEAVDNHIQDVLDRYVRPSSFNEQVEIINELINIDIFSQHLDKNHPERYARNYEELIRGLANAIKAQSIQIRRL